MRSTNRKTGIRALVAAIAVLAALTAVLLTVANRFWFEHPEPIPSQPAPVQNTVAPTTPPEAVSAVTPSATPEPTPEPTPKPELSIEGGELLDMYEDETVTLQLRRFETGTGQDRVTYFTAEVIVLDMNRLATGFAKDTFGRNVQEKPSTISARLGALLAINGDYYGFREDGVLIRNSTLYRDLPAREGAAFLSDGRMLIYDETQISAAELLEMGAQHTFSFGPVLLRNGEAGDGYDHGISGPNPRTAVGMIEPGHFVFVVVDGRLKGYSRGLSLRELSALFAELGCTDAYNLDGGGSSTMIWQGELTNRPQGKTTERATSDILYITGE